MSVWRLLGLGLLAAALGDRAAPRDQRAYAALVGVIYLVLCVLPLHLLRWLPVGVRYRLVPEGLLELRRGARVLHRHSNIAAAWLTDLYGNLTIAVLLLEPEAAEYLEGGPGFRARHQRGLSRALRWSGMHLALMGVNTEAPLPVVLEGLRQEPEGS